MQSERNDRCNLKTLSAYTIVGKSQKYTELTTSKSRRLVIVYFIKALIKKKKRKDFHHEDRTFYDREK